MTRHTMARGFSSVNGYQVLAALGRGPTGAVFKARKEDTGESVAIKLIRPEKSDSADRVRHFKLDCRAAMRLSHTNLVKVFDVGAWNDGLYVVTELVAGRSLAAQLGKHGRLKPADAVPLIAQAASALNHVHQNGMLHCNVKPENILLSPDGWAKLGDPGLMRLPDADGDLSRASLGQGTPNYMAPEFLLAPLHADPRCDVYSLGATLYNAITGEVPFRAGTMAGVLKKKLNGDLPPAWALMPGLSEHIDQTITRALNADPRLRQPNCSMFLNDLMGKKTQVIRLRRPGTASPSLAPAEPNYDGKERRRRQRYRADEEGRCVSFASHKEDQWVAQLNDISLTGVGLTVNRRFEIGTMLMLSFPERLEAGQGLLVVQVVRQKTLQGRKWQLGCAFTHPISEEEMKALISSEGTGQAES